MSIEMDTFSGGGQSSGDDNMPLLEDGSGIDMPETKTEKPVGSSGNGARSSTNIIEWIHARLKSFCFFMAKLCWICNLLIKRVTIDPMFFMLALTLELCFTLVNIKDRLKGVILRSAASYVLGYRCSLQSWLFAWIIMWAAKLNYWYVLLTLLVIEMFTGFVFTFFLVLLDMFFVFYYHSSIRVFFALALVYVLLTSKVFRLWLLSLFVVSTKTDKRWNFSGIQSVIRKVNTSDETSISHPLSCDVRNLGFFSCLAVAKHLGCRPYFVSKSRRVQAHRKEYFESGRNGGKVPWKRGDPPSGSTYSFNPDLSDINDPHLFDTMSDEVHGDDLLCMVDRDYYYDMTEVLLLGLPVCLYTFDPLYPCAVDSEFKYRFAEDGQVRGAVKGGTNWNHYLWNYPDDMLRVSKYGILRVFKVLRYRYISEHMTRSLIILCPVGCTYSGFDQPLLRRNPVRGKSVITYDFNAKGSLVYASPVGSYDKVVMKNGEWEYYISEVIARSTKPGVIKVSMPAIQEMMVTLGYKFEGEKLLKYKKYLRVVYHCLATLDFDDPHDRDTAAFYMAISTYDKLLEESIDDMDEYTGPSDEEELIPPTAMFIKDDGSGYDENPSSGMVSIAKDQLTGNSMVPARTVANMEGCVANRKLITQAESMALQNDDEIKDVLPMIKEFISQVLRGKQLTPFSEEQVCERMARPSQRSDYVSSTCDSSDIKGVPNLFQKAEVLSGDSRPITQEKGHRKWEFARFVYPITEVLKEFEWYAFGKSPPEVAARIAHICTNLRDGFKLILTDYSRFDGHLSAIIRHAIRELFVEAYMWDKEFRERIEELLEDRYYRAVQCDCCQSFLFWVLTYFDQWSGDQNTSNVGTFANALIIFCTLRRAGYGKEEAMTLLGMYGGDDGVTGIPETADVSKTARDFGLVLEVDFIDPFKDNVKFLARVYSPLVFSGDPSSCADIPRQLQKLFITEKRGVPRALKLYQKCFSHSLNDSNTPILGELCLAVVVAAEDLGFKSSFEEIAERSDGKPEGYYAITKDQFLSHWGVHALVYGQGFPNDNDGHWMDYYFDKVMPDFDKHSFQIRYDAAVIVSARRRMALEPEIAGYKAGKPLSKTRRLEMLDQILQPFLELGNFDADSHPKLKPGTHLIVRTNGDETEIKEDGPNRVPNSLEDVKPKDPPPKEKVHEYPVYEAVLSGEIPPPFSTLTPGARKCLFVCAYFVEYIVKEFPKSHKMCHFVYTGAYGEDIKQAVEIIRTLHPARIHLFDPIFQAPINRPVMDSLKAKDVTVRATKFGEYEANEIAQRAVKKDGSHTFPIFWLDDMFIGDEHTGGDARLMQMKFNWIKAFDGRLKAACMKVKGLNEFSMPCAELPYFHTPVCSNYFTDVHEYRAMGKITMLEQPINIDLRERHAKRITEMEAIMTLFRYDPVYKEE